MAVSAEDKIVRGGDLATVGAQIKAKLAEKQDLLVSGSNLKSINNTSLLGSGNITIQDGEDGASAYQLWIAAGNQGTVADFLESLKGDTGVVISEEDFMGTIVNDLTTGGADKALSAQQGKVLAGQVGTINDTLAGGDYEENIEITYNRSDATNIWLDSEGKFETNSSYRTIGIRVTGNSNYIVSVDQSSAAATFVGVLKKAPASGNASFATGYDSRFYVTVGSSEEFFVPSDAKFISLLLKSTSGEIYPTLYKVVEGHIDGFDDTKVKVASLREDVTTVEESLNWTEIDTADYAETGWYIDSYNHWNHNYNSILIPVDHGRSYMVNADGGKAVTVAWLKNSTKTSGARAPFSVYAPGRILIPKGSSYSGIAGEDANYLYVSTKNSSGDVTSTSYKGPVFDSRIKDVIEDESLVDISKLRSVVAAIGNTLIPVNPPVDQDGYEIPATVQQLNAVKKAKQLTSIEWSPKSDVPNNSGTFGAGSVVTGIPYSSAKEYDKFVGYNVSLYTFMTAVNNPYSLIYTENISSSSSASAWGRTYHGTNCACYFGLVCSALTGYCTGMESMWGTSMYNWLETHALKFAKLYLQDVQELKLGDIYWRDGHTILITGLKHDSTGKITHVIQSEAIGTRAIQRAEKSADAFMEQIATESAILYRNVELYKNTEYIPSEFVAVGDETITPFVYNNDICCFAGDKASFREGDLIAINYNLVSIGSWTQMELYKNDDLYDTIDINSAYHVLDLSDRNLTHGMYKARMKVGNNYSDYTYFEVIQTNVTAQMIDGMLSVTFSSANGTPTMLTVCNTGGGHLAEYGLTDFEIKNKYAYVDVIARNREQLPESPLFASNNFVKIFFVGQYGSVTNAPIQISLPEPDSSE